jgi:hypothetical protein
MAVAAARTPSAQPRLHRRSAGMGGAARASMVSMREGREREGEKMVGSREWRRKDKVISWEAEKSRGGTRIHGGRAVAG